MSRRNCDNNRVVSATEIEERVLGGLRTYLSAPEVIAAVAQAYRESPAAPLA